MLHAGWITAVVFLVDLVIRIGLSLRVIMRRLPAAVSLAWLAVILPFPFVGAFLYLFVGGYRFSRALQRNIKEALPVFDAWKKELQADSRRDPAALGLEAERLARVAESVLAAPWPKPTSSGEALNRCKGALCGSRGSSPATMTRMVSVPQRQSYTPA
jgi:hypothetical protein